MLEKAVSVLLGDSWKSSLGGWVVVILAWIAFDPPGELQRWPWVISFAKYLAAAGYIAKARVQGDKDK